MVIKIIDFIETEPEVLLKNITSNLSKKNVILLDFHKLQSIPYDFLEGSIGRLLDQSSFEKIQMQINFTNVDAGVKEMLSKIVRERVGE